MGWNRFQVWRKEHPQQQPGQRWTVSPCCFPVLKRSLRRYPPMSCGNDCFGGRGAVFGRKPPTKRAKRKKTQLGGRAFSKSSSTARQSPDSNVQTVQQGERGTRRLRNNGSQRAHSMPAAILRYCCLRHVLTAKSRVWQKPVDAAPRRLVAREALLSGAPNACKKHLDTSKFLFGNQMPRLPTAVPKQAL